MEGKVAKAIGVHYGRGEEDTVVITKIIQAGFRKVGAFRGEKGGLLMVLNDICALSCSIDSKIIVCSCLVLSWLSSWSLSSLVHLPVAR